MNFDIKDRSALVGVGNSAYGRKLMRSPIDLAADAVADALDDAGLTREQLDGLIVSFGSPLGADADTLAQVLGLNLRCYNQTWAHGRFTGSCIQWAAMMVNAGLADAVACLATVSFSGTGTGAAANSYIYGGKVIGVQITNFGSGYGPGTTVTITGDGIGAAASVQVGLPVWQNKELSVDCLASVSFAAAGSSPLQTNWTGAPITVPANATIDWIGNNGGWRAARFSQNDYVSPNGDGSLTVKTQSGDISLHPAGSGMLRIISDAESTGAVELIGRGSPLSVVSAPAGSTFRNLNGGVGTTFWIKQSGTGSSNWVAVA